MRDLLKRLRSGVVYYDSRDDAVMREAADALDALEAQGRRVAEYERLVIAQSNDLVNLRSRLAKTEALLFMARVGHARHHKTWGCAACNALSAELEGAPNE